jgi:hypothetical protein
VTFSSRNQPCCSARPPSTRQLKICSLKQPPRQAARPRATSRPTLSGQDPHAVVPKTEAQGSVGCHEWSAACARPGCAAARFPGPCAASFDYSPAGDAQCYDAIEPPGAEQCVRSQPGEHGDRKVGTEQILGSLPGCGRGGKPDPGAPFGHSRAGSKTAVPTVRTRPRCWSLLVHQTSAPGSPRRRCTGRAGRS